MSYSQLDLIKEYCDTSGVRLSSSEKNMLCDILENPETYNGFESEVHVEENEGKDHRGRWESTTEWQYRINIDSELSIDKRYRHGCDGYIQDEHWEWSKAWHITDTRRMVNILKEIETELY